MCSVQMEPGEHFNLLHGLNGQGKTNLLEAIYLLGCPRSFRTSRLPELVRHGERQSQIQGTVKSGGIENNLRLLIEAAGRKVEIDGKAVYKASELHGKLNSVVFSPDDTGMVRMGPESRRRYLDRAVYMGDSGYLHCWQSYQRILKQRNQLLKNSDRTGLDVWTEKLAETGAPLAGEMSGHVFFKERWFGFDDGLYTGARLLEILSRSADASAVLEALPQGVSTPELKIEMREGEPPALVKRLQTEAKFEGATEIFTIDGLRAEYADGFGLARSSNTTPVVVLRFEGDTPEALARIQQAFREQLLALAPNITLPF